MSTVLPSMKNLAHQLLELEASYSNAASFYIAVKVCEKLRTPITKYMGFDGYSMLLSRTLALSKGKAPSLGLLQVRSDGTLDFGSDVEKSQAILAAENAGLVLVTQLLELIVTFIGVPLTKMLVHSVWQDASSDGANVIKRKKS